MSDWWKNLDGAVSYNKQKQPILKMSRDELTAWAKKFGNYSGNNTLRWNDATDGTTWGQKFIKWSNNNSDNMSTYWTNNGWNWNPETSQTTTPETTTQIASAAPKWNSNPYNFTANDIRGYGSVQNLYRQYSAAAANNDFGNGYLAYLHDRYGNVWKNNLNRTSFEDTLRKFEGMNKGIRGRDYRQSYNSYQNWLADRNAAHANEIIAPAPKTGFADKLLSSLVIPLVNKTGEKLMNYYQEGGAVQDPQQQVVALVQAASQGDEQAQQTIQQIQQAAEKGDQQAIQIMQLIQQVVQEMQGQQAQTAKFGAKLAYIKHLKGECPEGTHLEYFKAGGRICKKCAQNAVKKDCKGSKIKKACGGATAGMNLIKAELGSKVKKKVVSAQDGDNLPTAPDASEAYKGGVYKEDSRNILKKLFSSEKRSSVSSDPRLHQFPRVITQIISGKDTTYTEVPATDSQDIRTKTRKASKKDEDFGIMKRRFRQAVSAATQKK